MTLLRYAGCALGFAVQAAVAQEVREETPPRLDYRVELGVSHSDNVNLNEDDPKSDTIVAPAFGFQYRQGGSTVQARVDGAMQYLDYLQNTFGDELRGQIGGHVNWTISPERLNFVVEDYLGLEPVDNLATNAPSNLQQTNVFALGPTFDFRFGTAARGQVEVRYINSYAEKSDQFNSNREVGAFRVIRDLTATSLASANVEAQHIDFVHDTGGPSFNRYNLFGRYAQSLRVFDYAFDLGYNWIKSGEPLGDHSHPLARFNGDWHPTERSRLGLVGAYHYSDAATDLLETIETRITPGRVAAQIATSIPTGAAVVSPSPYQETHFMLLYGFHDTPWAVDLSAHYQKLDYLNSFNDPFGGSSQILRGGELDLGYNFSPQITAGLLGVAETYDYPGLERTDHNWTYGLFYRQTLTPHWSWNAEYAHYKRDSNAPGQDVTQNVIFASVSYTR
ncbi:MAG TPA: outer membrane beta-barrel protein [Rhodanobacteraceae bacterium]|nr:outer membrane beta-barrel protein [Rhodanobacteraceae bacterium]